MASCIARLMARGACCALTRPPARRDRAHRRKPQVVRHRGGPPVDGTTAHQCVPRACCASGWDCKEPRQSSARPMPRPPPRRSLPSGSVMADKARIEALMAAGVRAGTGECSRFSSTLVREPLPRDGTRPRSNRRHTNRSIEASTTSY